MKGWMTFWLLVWICLPCDAAQRQFTVADDIRLVHFGESAITFSPDGHYFAVATERGLLERGRLESAIRIFRIRDVAAFLASRTAPRTAPVPYWTITKSTFQTGPTIREIRWLRNSSGILFLGTTSLGNDQLFLGDLNSKTILAMTPSHQHVTAFDVRDSKNFVYTALSPTIRERLIHDSRTTSVVGTGRSLNELIFAEYLDPSRLRRHDLDDLWAVVGGRRFRVKDHSSGEPLPIHLFGQQALALSPDGRSVVTALALSSVPGEWATLYPPSFSASAYRIKAGQQDVRGFDGQRYVSQYVLVDLTHGRVKRLLDAPLAHATGWWGLPHADWSINGSSIVVANTFLQRTEGADRPCAVAVVTVAKGSAVCLEQLKGPTPQGFEPGYHYIENVHFAAYDGTRVMVDYLLQNYFLKGSATYQYTADGTWRVESNPHNQKPPVDVSIRQGLNDPPALVATDPASNVSREIWNPNPQLKGISFGEVSVFKWKDATGRDWIGGLYKPPDYVSGRAYPMVIQTHGFDENAFSPSGIFTTANAAQELAAMGIVVLQVRDCPIRVTREEAACQVAGYEAAVEQLSAQGLVDPNNVGIIGFSRTCYYILEALTTSAVHFKAASITDGINAGYLQYVTRLDSGGNENAHETDQLIGASPFGNGLEWWIKESPEFNMDKISTPLQVVALGSASTLRMWEPYATLRYLNKPVDLLIVNSDEHVLTNPAARFTSQGGTVDWFRFWLKNAEDFDPAKAEQYARWRELRKLQEQTNQKPEDQSLN